MELEVKKQCCTCNYIECGYESNNEREIGCTSPRGAKWAESGYPKSFPFKNTRCKYHVVTVK